MSVDTCSFQHRPTRHHHFCNGNQPGPVVGTVQCRPESRPQEQRKLEETCLPPQERMKLQTGEVDLGDFQLAEPKNSKVSD